MLSRADTTFFFFFHIFDFNSTLKSFLYYKIRPTELTQSLNDSQFHHTAHEAHQTVYIISNLAVSHNLDSLKHKYYTISALYGQNLLCCHYTGLCLLTVQWLCAVSLRLAEDFAASEPSVWEIHTTHCMLDVLIYFNCTSIDSYGLIFLYISTCAHFPKMFSSQL